MTQIQKKIAKLMTYDQARRINMSTMRNMKRTTLKRRNMISITKDKHDQSQTIMTMKNDHNDQRDHVNINDKR